MRNLVWFIDTNVLANWVLGGGLLKELCDTFRVSDEFFLMYYDEYKISIQFIEKIINTNTSDLKHDEFYITYFAVNELFSAIRDEVRMLHMFKKRIPLSRWVTREEIPEIPPEYKEMIYTNTLGTFNKLTADKKIIFMPDIKPSEVEYYWEIYVDILLNNRIIQTQDTTLLMTAVINEADYFVTADDRLIGIAGDSMFADYDMQLITPGKAYEILKNRLD